MNLDLGWKMQANGLPYEIPIHPNLVHLTLGLLIIAIIFDLAATFFSLERPILKFLTLPATRAGFYDVGWYNLLAASVVTFFTVAAGFVELSLAEPLANQTSTWGLTADLTLFLHGLGGILLLAGIIALTFWRGWQRYYSRKNHPRQVQWSYLVVGVIMLGLLFVHGTLGAQLGDEFGIHNTAVHLLRQGENPSTVLK